MAIFKPNGGGSNHYFGICEIALNNFQDRTKEFEWADIFLDITVNQKGSEYTRNITIAGSFDKDSDGNITGGSVLKRMYTFFDGIGCTCGLNVKGEWEDEKGRVIPNIEEYLNREHVVPMVPDSLPDYKLIAYIFKEKPKKDGDKAWTKVYHKVYPNSTANVTKLTEDITWLKGKGVIKEVTDMPLISNGNSLSGSGLSSL